MIKPLLMLVGLVFGALLGGYIGANFGGAYISQLEYNSPDEQSDLYQMVFFGGAAVVGLLGLLVGWVIGALLTGKKKS